MVTAVFLQNGEKHNTFKYVSGLNCTKTFLKLLKGLYSSYPVLKFGNIFPINAWDIAQNDTLQSINAS